MQRQNERTGERVEKREVWEMDRGMAGQGEADTNQKIHEHQIENEVGEDQDYETQRVLHL